MSYGLHCPVLSLALVCLLARPSEAAQPGSVRVQGTVSFMVDRDRANLSLERVEYYPLPDTTIQAFRVKGVMLARTTSDGKGDFTLDPSPGRPFTVVFQHPDERRDLVPEIQQLCGDAGLQNQVHVTLLTVRQYEELNGNQILVEHLQLILRLLEAVDGEGAAELRNRVQRLLRKLPR